MLGGMRWIVLLTLLIGCPLEGEDPTLGPKVLHAIDGGFWDSPLPSQHRFADGLDLSGFPNPDDVGFVNDLKGMGPLWGAGTSSAITFRLEQAVEEEALPSFARSVEPGSAIFLIGLEGDDLGVRLPIDVHYEVDAGPFGAPNLLSLLPLQGRPMRPGSRYAAVITRSLTSLGGERFGHNPALLELAGAAEAAEQLAVWGLPTEEIAGLAVFTTQDPRAQLQAVLEDLRSRAVPEPTEPWTQVESFDDYCALRSMLDMPNYQQGEPPFETEGGTWAWDGDAPIWQGDEPSRIFVTVPRGPMPAGGWPTVVFVRTGGGGDRPLIDRGVRDEDGLVAIPGSGLARDFAAAGFAGVQVDGPHGGPRNATGGDEQFLMFNVSNPGAMRDNVRQSAVELARLPDVLEGLSLPNCDGSPLELDTSKLALFGHSMGATIGPLVVGAEPRYGAMILSGAGGSWIHNIVHKLSPLDVRPLAEAMLGYPQRGRSLHEHDPSLSLLQWAGESADPPVWGADVQAAGTHVLMEQGIVDTYILPPMANAASLSLGLVLAGGSLDAEDERLADLVPLAELLPLVGGAEVSLPFAGKAATRAVVQSLEDPIEDGHEVVFQLEEPRARVRCFLEGFAVGDVPSVGCP